MSTTTIGYPIYNDWNSNRYFMAYRLVVIGFPLLTAAGFLALSWAARRAGLYGNPSLRMSSTSQAAVQDTITWSEARALAGCLAATLTVGAILGFEVALHRDVMGTSFWLYAVGGGLVYGGTATVAALAVRMVSATGPLKTIAAFSAVGAVVTILGLSAVARVTTVTVLADGHTQRYDWFPLQIAAPITAAIGLVVFGSMWRARADGQAVRQIANRSLVFIALPVLIYLTYATVPGDSAGFSYFEDGQLLATVDFLRHGLLPYRDFFTVHGLLYDAFQPLVGMTLLDNSYWGMTAGWALIVMPLGLVILFVSTAAMYERAWPLALVAVLVPGYLSRPGSIFSILMTPYVRFMLWPLLLLMIKLAISRPRLGWSWATGAATVVNAIITPEAAYFVPAVGIAILGGDLYQHQRGWRPASFQRTAALIAGGGVALAAWGAFLLATGSLAAVVEFYRVTAADHGLQGAFPVYVDLHQPVVFVAAAAPVVGSLLSMFWIAIRLRWRLPLVDLDWVMIAAAVLTLVYYEKFLARPDGHVFEAYGAALPLLLVMMARAVLVLDSTWRRVIRNRRPVRWVNAPASLVAVVAALVMVHGSLLTSVPQTARQYHSTAAAEPREARLGYLTPGTFNYAQLEDVRAFLGAYLHPGESVFDFTNTPGLYYYLLGYSPVTSNYEVSVATDERAQQDVIDQLRQRRPQFVVWYSIGIGQPAWDYIQNMVRHYLVSQYILDNYRPFALVGDQVFYVRKSAVLPPPQPMPVQLQQPWATEGLEFLPANPCSWQYAPDFLSERPTADRVAHGVEPASGPAPADRSSVTLNLPRGGSWSDFRWLEVHFAQAPPNGSFALFDRPTPGHQITFDTTGRGPSTIWIPIGACAQWHGYAAGPLTFTQSTPREVTLTLVP